MHPGIGMCGGLFTATEVELWGRKIELLPQAKTLPSSQSNQREIYKIGLLSRRSRQNMRHAF
jgi:hypothetical protein